MDKCWQRKQRLNLTGVSLPTGMTGDTFDEKGDVELHCKRQRREDQPGLRSTGSGIRRAYVGPWLYH